MQSTENYKYPCHPIYFRCLDTIQQVYNSVTHGVHANVTIQCIRNRINENRIRSYDKNEILFAHL